MKILIQGAGALGSLLGFRLAASGHDLTLGFRRPPTAWPEQNGHPTLTLVSPQAEAPRSYPVRLYWPGEPLVPVDLLLITAKAPDAAEAARLSRTLLAGEDSPAVLFSNGLGVEDGVGLSLGRPFVRGLAYCGALLEGPGAVRLTGEGKLVLDAWPRSPGGSAPGDARLDSLVELFQEAGFAAQRAEDMTREVWAKAMANLAINPLGALARVRNGLVEADPRLRELATRILEEACAVAAVEGVAIPLREAERIFRATAAATAENENSMLRDLMEGRETEIDSLNGFIERRGRAAGIPVPLNASLTALVKAFHPADGSPHA